MSWDKGLPDGFLSKMDSYETQVRALKSRLDIVELKFDSYKKAYERIEGILYTLQHGVGSKTKQKHPPAEFLIDKMAAKVYASENVKKKKAVADEDLERAKKALALLFNKEFTEYEPTEAELRTKQYWTYKKIYNWLLLRTKGNPIYRKYFKLDRLKEALIEGGFDVQSKVGTFKGFNGQDYYRNYVNVRPNHSK